MAPLQLAALLRSRRLRRLLWWTLGVFVAFNLVGFLVLPPLAKRLLEDRLGEAFHRPVSIESVRTNPYVWSAEVSGLSVRADGDQELLGFDKLYVDAEAASLLEGGLVVREARLEGPRLRVVRLGRGRYDISDLIEAWSQPSDGPAPHFAVSNIQVSGGRITFVDQPKGRHHTIADLSLRLPFLSSLPYQADVFVEPHFSAKINGAPLVLAGRSKPFAESHESELSLDLDRVELTQYLPYAPLTLPFELRSGSLDTELKLLFRQNRNQPATLKLVGGFHLNDLALKEAGGAPLLTWKRLDVGVREADLLRGHFAIDTVRLAGANGQVRMGRNGTLNWVDIADRLAGGQAQPKTAATSTATWTVDKVLIEDGSFSFQDERRAGLSAQVLDRIDAKFIGLASDPGKRIGVALDGRANGSGTISAGGSLQLQPFAVRLELDMNSLPLLPLQPYFGERLNLALTRGQLSGQGTLELLPGKAGLEGGFKGDLTLGDVQGIDKASRADFLKWKSLFIGDIDARLQPLALSVGEVALSEFYARLIVSSQGKLNLMNIVRPPAEPTAGTERGGASSPPKAAAAVASTSRQAQPVPIRIGKVGLQGGTINFSDYFVKPNYSVNVTRIGGRITGLSSAPNTLADLELRGNYGNAAPVEIRAKLNPLTAKTYLDLKGEIRGVDLIPLSTYAGKYAGYAIEKGKLSLYVTYHLENNQLTADNRVFLDQLAFGDKVDSPAATSLPVKLAIALLKNSRGEIDVNLPISGSIDDPQFSLGGVLARVIGNLFIRTVTSPFSLLSSLFGGGEELSTVEFPAGRAALGTAVLHRLEILAKAMGERPGLKLEITGRADPEADREGLKRVALEQAVKAQKQKDLARKGSDVGSPEGVQVDAKEYSTYLRRAYREAKFPKPRNLIGLHKDLPVEEMEKLMLANLAVGEEELRRLASRRAEVVQAWLAEQGKVPQERLFLMPPRLAAEDKASSSCRVDFSLR